MRKLRFEDMSRITGGTRGARDGPMDHSRSRSFLNVDYTLLRYNAFTTLAENLQAVPNDATFQRTGVLAD